MPRPKPTVIKGEKTTIKLVVKETIERIAIVLNTAEKMKEIDKNSLSNIEAFIMPTQKWLSMDVSKLRGAMQRMSPYQLEALGKSMLLIAEKAKKYIK